MFTFSLPSFFNRVYIEYTLCYTQVEPLSTFNKNQLGTVSAYILLPCNRGMDVFMNSLGSLSKLTRRLRGGGQQANFYSEGLEVK